MEMELFTGELVVGTQIVKTDRIEGVQIDLIEGGHVYYERGGVSWFKDWDELTEDQQQQALRYKKVLNAQLDIVESLLPDDPY